VEGRHAHAHGGQRVVAVERLRVRPALAPGRVGEDREPLGPDLLDGVAGNPLRLIGFLNAHEAIDHPQHVDAVALVVGRLQAIVGDLTLGFEHLGRVAGQLEQRRGLEVERLLA